ncbi:MAG: hypothetical protein E6R03_03535 [Hyphomicrobiaceae bacterium]|jgi:hypothetical protein|nr:MAG: hypothetical protein E6R03_03535 [Hyphomicrobiaceae bacterium]
MNESKKESESKFIERVKEDVASGLRLMSVPADGRSAIEEADRLFFDAIGTAVAIYMWHKQEYGNHWFSQPVRDAEVAAAFGLQKFAERIYSSVFLRRTPRPESGKLISNACDAINFAAMVAALVERQKRATEEEKGGA